MYVNQDKAHVAGAHNGGLGQVPSSTVSVKHPLTGAKISLTGPVNETSQATAFFNVLAAATSNSSALLQARQMLPGLGSLQAKVLPILLEMEQPQNLVYAMSLPMSLPSTPIWKTPIFIGGAAIAAVGLILLLKRIF